MAVQPHNSTAVDPDEGIRVEDVFRRTTFGWAVATMRMVESSKALGSHTKVARSALKDIEHARDLLDGLFVPTDVKLPGFAEDEKPITAGEVKESVFNLATRAGISSAESAPKSGQVRMMVGVDPPKPQSAHRGAADWSAPVYPKNGKALWAGVDCPSCSAKASQRCRFNDTFIEKPHAERKRIAEVA